MDKKDGEEQFGGEKQGGKEGWRRVVRKEKQGVIGSRVEREGEQGAKEGWRTGWKGRMESRLERKNEGGWLGGRRNESKD